MISNINKSLLIIFLCCLYLSASNILVAEDLNQLQIKPEINTQQQETQTTSLEEVTLIDYFIPKNYTLTLEDSLNMSLENNSAFNVTKKDTQIYKIRAKKTALTFLPVLNTSLSFIYQKDYSKVGDGDIIEIPYIGPVDFGGFDAEDNWKRYYSLTAIQPITGLLRRYHWKKIADLSFEQALLDEELTGQNTAMTVYTSYFEALAAKYQIEALKQNVEELTKSYNIASIRYEEGTTIKRDKQKVEVELDKVKFQLFAKENEYQENINKLKNAIAIKQEDNLQLVTQYQPLEYKISVDEATKIALDNNQELQKSVLRLKMAKHSKNELYNNYIPDINLSLNYVNQAGSDYMPPNNFTLSFDMNYNVFDWGQRELTIKEHQLEIDKLDLTNKDLVEVLKMDMKQKYNRFKEAEMLIELSKKAVGLAEHNLEISLLRYRDGYELITEVLSDQSDLAKARSDYYQALFYEQITIADLKKSMGILLPSQ
ncbi:MAG: TolC family protein [Cyanobacteriota bacterium]